MRDLFDQGTPVRPRQALVNQVVETACERGRATYKNGELIAAAEAAGFDILVTADKNLKYQQNMPSRTIAQSTSWPRLQRVLPQAVSADGLASKGTYTELRVE